MVQKDQHWLRVGRLWTPETQSRRFELHRVTFTVNFSVKPPPPQETLFSSKAQTKNDVLYTHLSLDASDANRSKSAVIAAIFVSTIISCGRGGGLVPTIQKYIFMNIIQEYERSLREPAPLLTFHLIEPRRVPVGEQFGSDK